MRILLKKSSILTCSSILLFTLYSPAVFASPSMSNNKVSEEEEKSLVTNEDYVENNKVILEVSLEKQNKNKNQLLSQPSNLLITEPGTDAIAVEYGTSKIVNYAYAGTGVIDTAEDTESGVFNNIKGLAMTIAGEFVDTAGSVIIGAADVASTYIKFDQYSTAKTYKSYRYIGKETQIYTTSGWKKYYDARSRQTYKHYFGTYVTTSGSTRTDTTDYTFDRGYSPIKTIYSANYKNDTELRNRGWYNWKFGSTYRYPEYY